MDVFSDLRNFLRFKEYQNMILLFNITIFYQVKCRHIGHVENVTEENRDEILMKNLMEQCDEKLMDLLDDKKVFYVNNVNHYRNLYAVCIDTDFNWLMSLVICGL
jgi:hypothetical protein